MEHLDPVTGLPTGPRGGTTTSQGRRTNVALEPRTRQALMEERRRRRTSYSQIVTEALREWLRLDDPPSPGPRYTMTAAPPEAQTMPGGMIRTQITLPSDVRKAVADAAHDLEVSRAEIVRRALRTALNLG